MKKTYMKPDVEINFFSVENIINTSGTTPTKLTNGGSNGSAGSESYSSLFGA